MGDQVQELRDFGLEGMGVFRHSKSYKEKSTSHSYEESRPDFKLSGVKEGLPNGAKSKKILKMFKTFHQQTNTATAPRANSPKLPVQCARVSSPPRANLRIRTFDEFVVFCLLLG